MTQADRRKSPVVAGLLSGVFPGLGQLYCRQWGKGLAYLGATALVDASAGVSKGLLDFMTNRVLPEDLARLLVGTTLMLAVAAWSVVDAIRAARRTGTE